MLIKGTLETVAVEVWRNIRVFKSYNGFIVSNSHHGQADMPEENLNVMAWGVSRIPASKSAQGACYQVDFYNSP